MSEILTFVSREEQLTHTIAQQVIQICNVSPLMLPAPNDPIVLSYVKKIEGSYNTERAKKDTDHAIDLLYIAYNTTPQARGEIRVAISRIMDKLIDAQQNSERSIADAREVAKRIRKALEDNLPEWLDIKDEGKQDEIKVFVSKELLALAQLIEKKAETIKQQLDAVTSTYDDIIADTSKVTADSELALSEVISSNARLRSEITQGKSRSVELETLVRSLSTQIADFQRQAEDYKARAESAESKSFWASVLQTMFEVATVVVPIAALASGVSSPVVVAGVVGGSVNRNIAKGNQAKEALRAKEDQARLVSELNTHQNSINERSELLEQLEAQRETVAADNEHSLLALDDRINNTKQDLEVDREKHARTLNSLTQVERLLLTLEQKAEDVSAEQKDQVVTLRGLQLEMLTKIEEYENKRGEQEAELAKVSALLAGSRSEAESNELAIRSLNLSISALKRTKEIVEEIAFFFLSFSSFMRVVASDAAARVSDYEQASNSEVLRSHRLRQLLQSTDEFFIEQAGQWLAVGKVSGGFCEAFKEGWSKLNALNGKYITGDELHEYLSEAAQKLDEIAIARKLDKEQRISDLNSYRQMLQASQD